MYKRAYILLVMIGILLSGCSVSRQDTGTAGASEDVSAEKEMSEQGNSEVENSEQNEPADAYEAQIDLIVKSREMWCYVCTGIEPEERFVSERDYYYQVSDMDQNGRLEIISSTTTGNGSIFYNNYYEVSADGKKLEKLSKQTPDEGDVPEPDLWDFSGYSEGYYDKNTGNYHYVQFDHTHSSAIDTEDAREDMTLSDGVVSIATVCKTKSTSTEENILARAKEATQKYYQGMEKFNVTFQWFRSINERTYRDSNEIVVISDGELKEKLLDSWNSFGIHYIEQESVQNVENPYFPVEAVKDTEVNFRWNMTASGKAAMKFQVNEVGKEGILYQVSCHNPKEISDMEGSKVDKSIKNEVKEWLNQYSFYLWVTNTKIYYIPNFYSDPYGVDEYAKMKLLFYNEMPECAVMVCQDEEIMDTLAEMESGEHQWIEQHPGDIRCYRSYTSKGEGNDTSDILQFVWKKNIGLLGMRYAAHPAGGFSGYFWRDSYLEIDDMMFSIDSE